MILLDDLKWNWLFFRSEIKRPSPEEIRKVREQELEEDLAIANVSIQEVLGSNLTNSNLFYWFKLFLLVSGKGPCSNLTQNNFFISFCKVTALLFDQKKGSWVRTLLKAIFYRLKSILILSLRVIFFRLIKYS